ncbi:hypothetical protein Pse7429DRAFT_0236 [Pseudanabaena biceps PCC 7429]|uniref:Uncharacterized protein n=1 Tax=Pseudanabaena biceps PCC 7429 TaxID=927668 RepID=L8N797_9CYAN|nr:hypothetical protein Pse7429DRAFT_0236 [Pseudanabaena biceps PCC 7429]
MLSVNLTHLIDDENVTKQCVRCDGKEEYAVPNVKA